MIYKSLKPFLIFLTTLIILRLRFTFPSLFLYLSVRLAPSFVRSFSICPCGSHRSLFVLCSFFVRSLFVLCSSFVRLLFVFCSSFVRLLFVFCSSFHYLPVVLRLPVWLTLPVVLRPHTLPFIFNNWYHWHYWHY